MTGHGIIYLFLIIVLTGGVCEMEPTSEPVTLEEIIGVYEASHDSAMIDRLELRLDSTYVRRFVGKDGREFHDSGTYRFWHEDGDLRYSHIRFFNFNHHFVTEPPRTSPQRYSWWDTTYATWGSVFFKRSGKPLRLKRCTYDQSYFKVR